MEVAISRLRAGRGPREGRKGAGFSGFGFLAPTVLLNLLVVIGPCVATFVYSLTDYKGFGGFHFIGLSNYSALATSGEFHAALWHNLEWTAVFLVVPMAMGLIAAFAVSQVRHGQKLFRAIFFLPYIVQPVVVAALWTQIYSGRLGGAVFGHVVPLGNPSLALWAVALANIWCWWGFLAVVFLSAMQAVPRELYEAAELDGAGPVRQALHVTLPGIRSTVLFMVVMTIIWSLLVFTYIYIMTGGGPAGASDVVATLLYREAFENQHVGLAAAMGVVLVFGSALFSGIYVLLTRRDGIETA
jgi:raffinose/stachyose/melibiose transport system permease protein